MRQAFAGDFVYRAHGQTVTVGVYQVFVDPGLCLGRKLVYHQFPCGQHDLSISVIDHITVHVHVAKIVIEPYGLNLPVGLQQRGFVPYPDILDGCVVRFDLCGAQLVISLKIDLLDVIEVIGLACKINVKSDVRGFLGQFIGSDHKLLDDVRKTVSQQENSAEPYPAADQEQFHPRPESVIYEKQAPQKGYHHQDPVSRHFDNNICIACAKGGSLGRIKKPVDL